VITGTAPGAELKRITLITNSDQITFLEIPLAEGVVDSTGKFSFNIDISETSLVTVSIDFHKAELFLEPGKSYQIRIAPMRYEDYTEVNPFIQSQKLTLEWDQTDASELNTVLAKFNAIHSSFLMDHFNALYRDRNKTVLDSFRLTVSREFGEVTNKYFIDYRTYKIASLEQLTRYYNPQTIAYKYFSAAPILYSNVEYMEFFNNYFSKYITSASNTLRKLDYNAILKTQDPYMAMMKALNADTLLKKEPLRELVMLKGLMELYNSGIYNQEEVLKTITAVAEKSKFAENKNIATNLEKILTRLKPGAVAPGFSLLDQNQKIVKLETLKGKPIVLNFWTTYCEGCLAEMDMIKPIYDKFGNRVHFVSIAADKYYSKMLYFINLKKEYVWNFLHIGDQSEVLKEYDVRSYPLFVLIDRDGKIVKYPAELPSKGLEAELQKLLVR
jgi:thiol-disulfide isomerase/thioredoxin